MNPFNLLINYIIANSRASFYNVSGNQEITNTALLTGMVSENPLMSYLIIDNKAKIEGEKFSATVAATDPKGTTSNSGGTAPSTPPVINPPSDTGTPTNTTETPAVTLDAVKKEILISNQILKVEIANILESNKTELHKIIAEKLDYKITSLEKSNIAINDSILEIKKRLDAISKSNPGLDTTTAVPNKGISNQKGATKNEPK